MLKPTHVGSARNVFKPAAFRRLCVETILSSGMPLTKSPAAFRRLCVETYEGLSIAVNEVSSRLQAAVC